MSNLLVLYLALGLALLAVAIPLAFRQIGPGGVSGLLPRKTRMDLRLWYEASEYAGALLIIVGATIALTAVLLVFIPGLSVSAYATIEAALIVGMVGGVVALCYRFVATRER